MEEIGKKHLHLTEEGVTIQSLRGSFIILIHRCPGSHKVIQCTQGLDMTYLPEKVAMKRLPPKIKGLIE
jgi:hypothetical protein